LASVVALIGVMSGTATAFLADRLPAHRDTIETGAGILLIGGLALLGTVLPAML
jgi:hypothetical protein